MQASPPQAEYCGGAAGFEDEQVTDDFVKSEASSVKQGPALGGSKIWYGWKEMGRSWPV